ncbi:MAG TPA: TonB-dependent receptor [Candidatus Sulfotelmatobacter sp.]|nr:TonB-dependent receptor [Candidatus Sulfotelmatobacter sp.]
MRVPPSKNPVWLLKNLGIFLLALPAMGQGNMGELRVKVTDPHGFGVKTAVELVCEVNEYQNTFATDDSGGIVAKRLPFGLYRVQIRQSGFAEVSVPIEIRSAAPVEYTISLGLPTVTASVTVQAMDTLIDPHRAGSVNEIGSQAIETRTTSLPGRSLQDLVNSQPGWLYEGNAVLHPRGAEYQTQFVVDGIPLIDNRSPSFGPEIEADDVDSMSIYTAGIPAEFGRKMGGVVEVNTLKEAKPGFHGQVDLSGGSFDTAGAFAQGQYAWKGNTLGASASGSMTSHYLNPVVPENYTNNGTTGDFSLHYERDITTKDRLGLIARHDFSRFQIPNELVQQEAGQRQYGDNFETMGIVSYQHVFSENTLGAVRGMVRDNSSDLTSNPQSTRVVAFQHNRFREGYFNGSLAVHHGRHEFKAGIESDNLFLHENFSDIITDPAQFEAGTPLTFVFPGLRPSEASRPDLEQGAYVQDLIRLGKWTVSAGLRWDHYQLLANENAVSPRLSVARFFSSSGLVVHASYDRVFQTPSFANILLSSSQQVTSLNPNVLRLPIKPSHGNYFEVGATKSFFGQFRLDANYYRRYADNFADDDQLLSTAVSFPIAFRKSIIYGAEGKIELPKWRHVSGFASYSYQVGNVWFPVTGGLFLGDEAINAQTRISGHTPDSQDQRNTVRLRGRYQVASRFWVAGGAEYGSGLPFDCSEICQQALADYGQAVLDRVNFVRYRVRPSLAVDVSAGADVHKSDRFSTQLQADVQNLNNRLNVLDFGGLFSGNAIAPLRSYSLRLQTIF